MTSRFCSLVANISRRATCASQGLSSLTSSAYTSSSIVNTNNGCSSTFRALSTVTASEEPLVPVAEGAAAAVAAADVIPLPRVTMVYHPHPINGLPLDETKPAELKERFAVVAVGGTQFKVTVDDVIIVNKLKDVDIGDVLDLDQVLLVGSRKMTIVGRPWIKEAKVVVSVEEQAKDAKKLTLKHRRRKNSQRLRGFRRQVTVLRINDITLGGGNDSVL